MATTKSSAALTVEGIVGSLLLDTVDLRNTGYETATRIEGSIRHKTVIVDGKNK